MLDEEQMSSLRLAPKLTRHHFDMLPFKKMNVRLAAQLLSHSTAAAVRTYTHFGRLEEAALDTADFVEKVNQLFDCLNSTSVAAEHKWKKPLTLRAVDQLNFLHEAGEWVGRWSFVNRVTGKVKTTLPFHHGLQQTVNGILSASSDLLHNHNFRYVLTSRFNQDAIENFFSLVRASGVNNDTRTSWEYETSVKHVAVNWLLDHPKSGANCEPDSDSFLSILNHVKCWKSKKESDIDAGGSNVTSVQADEMTATAAAVSHVDLCESFDDTSVTDWPDLFELADVEANVVAYVCGYLCMKIDKRTGCSECAALYKQYRSNFSYNECCHFLSHEAFGHFKNFDWAKHGLQKPTLTLYSLCSAVEKVVQMNIESVVSGRYNVVARLMEVVTQAIDIHSYHVDSVCSSHQECYVTYAIKLYLRLRIHHFVRIRNRELKELELRKKSGCKKKNRKLEKISHR